MWPLQKISHWSFHAKRRGWLRQQEIRQCKVWCRKTKRIGIRSQIPRSNFCLPYPIINSPGRFHNATYRGGIPRQRYSGGYPKWCERKNMAGIGKRISGRKSGLQFYPDLSRLVTKIRRKRKICWCQTGVRETIPRWQFVKPTNMGAGSRIYSTPQHGRISICTQASKWIRTTRIRQVRFGVDISY